MSGRLRALLDRPLDRRARARTFALASTTLLLTATSLLTLGRAQPHPTPRPAPPSGAAITPWVSGEPSAATGRPSPSTDAERAVRGFLAGYLDYLYGYGPAARIRGATRRLVRRLTRHRPRVSPATRRRRPRVTELHSRPAPDGATAIAVIDDGGVARYPIDLTLDQRSGEWVVTDVGTD